MSGADNGDSLLARTASGAGWVIGWRMATRLLGLLSTLVLARVLGPGDFGLVALASGFTQTVDALTDFSVNEAIVRDPAPDRPLYDTAFTMSLTRGLVTTAVVAGVAWPAAAFFHEPRLAPVLFALALASLVGALENVRSADLVRTFQFGREFRLWTLPRVVQVAATIGVALLFRSYWALVFGIVLGRLLRTGLSYVMIPYLPRFSLAAWRRILGFTTWSWAVWLTVVVRDRVDTFLIGRIFTPAQVGVYALGAEIAALPTTELIESLARACFPSFAQLRNQGLSAGSAYVRLLGAGAMLAFPAGSGIAAVADPLVRLAFGPGWLDAIPMIQILSTAACLGVIGSLSGTLFSAFGLLRVSFTVLCTVTVARAVLLVLLVPGGGLNAAAIVIAGMTLAEQAVMLILTMRRFGVRTVQLVSALGRTVLACGAMMATMAVTGFGFQPVPDQVPQALAGSVAFGAAVYAVALGSLWLLAGRPDGPERDLLTIAERLTGQLRKRLPRWPSPTT